MQLVECRARRRACVVRRGSRGNVVGASLLREASGVGVEVRVVTRGVVEPRREGDDLAGIGRHRGQVRTPRARPGREVLVGVADCGAALSEPSGAGADGLCGLARRGSLRIPRVFQRRGGVLRTRGDRGFEAPQPSNSGLGVGASLVVGAVQRRAGPRRASRVTATMSRSRSRRRYRASSSRLSAPASMVHARRSSSSTCSSGRSRA